MVHPATQRVVKAALAALDAPLDLGLVFPPRPGEDRGYGQWTNRSLTAREVVDLLPRAAAANIRGGHVYIRLAPATKTAHPGLVLVDDVTADAVDQLATDGYEPRLVVETSPKNFQVWIRLISTGTVPYNVMHNAARHLAEHYSGDMRAISPRQPGRLPGFTNRKIKHQRTDGSFQFVRLTAAHPGRVASAGQELVEKLTIATEAAAPGGAPQTPRIAAVSLPELGLETPDRLGSIYQNQKARINREVNKGSRPAEAASDSEVDFAMTRVALASGVAKHEIVEWIRRNRPDKGASYAQRTIEASIAWRPGPKF